MKLLKFNFSDQNSLIFPLNVISNDFFHHYNGFKNICAFNNAKKELLSEVLGQGESKNITTMAYLNSVRS